jgi:3-oxoacyl-[acyl-carrier protein] reductase
MPHPSKLSGKRALVTAGAQGIGLAISRELLAAGCDVFVHFHRSADAAKALTGEAAKLGRRCGCAGADLTESEECDRLVAEAVAFLGGLDILVNNAGTMVAKLLLADASDDFWAEVMSLNMGSMRKVTRAAAPHLATAARTGGGASIVNISSVAGRKGGAPGTLAYSTAKGATLAFTRALAEELGPQGIRVNAITPGLILGSQFHVIHTKPEAIPGIVAGIPLGRPGTTEDVARAVTFLAAEFDGFISGATLDINGAAYRA